MTNDSSKLDAPLVVAAFLARYFADQEAGTVQSRADYEALFPGFGNVVAKEFDRLQQGQATVDEVVGERLAGYRIVRELGRGGQGIVYLAEDEKLERQVALKVLPGAFSATVARQRLLREAQAASRLEDPGICTVYDAGEQDGVAFIAMQFVDGESLEERIERERQQQAAGGASLADALRVKELLATFEAVLRSLHRAHEKGLVHRDIKPSNLMLGADGTPMILDFGLAAFDDHPDGSLTGEVALGTPAYMSPEQLTAREGRVDARSDVFSLAVTLYESFALVHPFEAPTRERLYQHILQDEAPSLRKRAKGLPRDLDVVLQCALDKDRTRRYTSALAFAEDLRAVRLAEPISARKVSAFERTARWAQRNPLIATLATLLLVTMAVFVYVTIDKNRDLYAALDDAEDSNQRATAALTKERAARERSDALYLVGLASGQLDEDPELALLLAREARRRLDHHLTRSTLRMALERWQPRPLLPGVEDAQWAKFSMDGAKLAVGRQDTIELFDVATHASTCLIESAGCSSADIWWSPDGGHVLVADRNKLHVFEGDHVVFGPRPVRLLRTDGTLVAELDGHRGSVRSVVFDGAWLLTADGPVDDGDHEGTVRVFRVADGSAVFSLGGAQHGVAAARFHGKERAGGYPDIEVLSRDGVYRRVQGNRGKVLDERRIVAEDVERLPEVFLAEHATVCVDRRDRIDVYQARTQDPPKQLQCDGGLRRMLPNGVLVSVFDERTISLPAPERAPRRLAMPPRELVHVDGGRRVRFRGSFFRNTTTTLREDCVQAVFADGSMRIWSVTDQSFEEWPPIGGGVAAADFSAEGDVVAVVDPQGRVRVFPVRGGAMLPRWERSRVSPWEALHPDGRHVLTFRREGERSDEAVLVDMSTGAEVWAVEPVGRRSHVVAEWSADGETCAVGAEDGEFQLVRKADGEILLQVPSGPKKREVRQFAFDPTGRYLAVLRAHAELWDLQSQQQVHVWKDVPMTVSMRFAANGTRIVLAHVQSHQVRSVPGGERVGEGEDGPWSKGVPANAVGPYVLLTRWSESRNSRVGNDGENWLLDTRDATKQRLPGERIGRGGMSPDGRLVALPQQDGSIEMFDREQGKVVRTLRGHDNKINRACFSADGAVFVTAYASIGFSDGLDERRVCVWSRDGELLQEVEFERAGVAWVDMSRDGEWFVVKTNDGELRRYPVHPTRLAQQLQLREFSEIERERFDLR